MIRCLILLLSLCVANATQAFNCYMTVMKGSCWSNYNVSIDVLDASNDKKIMTLSLLNNKLWNRQPFECTPNQTFNFQATFNPAIWQGDTDTVYLSKSSIQLPMVITKEARAWDVSVCFPESFAEVPTPPNNNGSCACDSSSVPAVLPP